MQVWGFVGLRPIRNRRKLLILMVGAEGFEPPTLCSQSRCATRLRYAPTDDLIVSRNAFDPAFDMSVILASMQPMAQRESRELNFNEYPLVGR
jgi:hypothetical protein